MSQSLRRRLFAIALCGIPAGRTLAAATSQPAATQTAADYERTAETLHRANRADPLKWSEERNAWQAAVRADPHDLTALRGLFNLEVDAIQFAPATPTGPDRLRAAADALLARDPDDARAAAWREIAGILKAAAHDELTARDGHLKAAVDVLTAHPEPSDAATYVVAMLLGKARVAQARGNDDEASQLVEQAVTMFDRCLAARSDDPAALLRAYDLYRSADLLQRRAAGGATTAPSTYAQRIPELLEKARSHLGENDPAASEVYSAIAGLKQAHGDIAGAVQAARDGLKALPNDQFLRLTLATLIRTDAAGRREAIALLRQPVTDPGGPGILSFHRHDMLVSVTEAELLVTLLSEHAAISTTDTAARAAVIAQAEEAMAALERAAPAGEPMVLKAKARLSLERGGPQDGVDAVAALEKARDALRHASGGSPAATDWELETLLAQAYLTTNQTGLAKSQLWRVIEARPTSVSARLALARLLIQEHDLDLAREQIDAVRKLAPANADLPKLEAQMAMAESAAHDPKESAEALAQMPEGTPAEVRSKAAVAIVARQPDEAIRLLEGRLKADPADVAAVRLLADLYVSQNRRDDAARVTDAALAKSPDDLALQIIRAQVDKDAAKVKALTLKGIEAMPDALKRELALYDYYRVNGTAAETMAHLDAAERIAPDDTHVLDLRFGNALLAHRWDEAERYAAKLAERDADEANGLIYRYRLHAARADLDAAERDANEMLLRFPQYARAWQYLGDALRAKGRYDEAIAKYTSALERQTGSLDALRGMVESLNALRRPRDARRYLDEAARLFPNDPWVHEQSIVWEEQFGDVDKGVAMRRADRDARPDAFAPNIAYAGACYRAARRLMAGAAAIGEAGPTTTPAATRPADFVRAEVFAERAKAALEDVSARWPDELLPYAYLADLGILTHQFDLGEAALKRLADRPRWQPSNEPQALLAEYYVRCHRPDQAVTAYAAALHKGRLAASHLAAATSFLQSRGKYDLVLDTLDRSTKVPAAQRTLAETLVSAGKVDEAIQYLDGLIARHPADPSILLAAKAFALMKARRYDDAIAAADAAIQSKPDLPDGYYYRGTIRLKRDPAHPDAAVDDFQLARDHTTLANAPVYGMMRQALGAAYLRTGEPQRAAAAWEEALKAVPHDTALRLRLIDLYGTRMAEPRWDDAQRLLDAARADPFYAADATWNEAAARLEIARKRPTQALIALSAALLQYRQAGDEGRALLLFKLRFDLLLELKQYAPLRQEADALLKNPIIAARGWWIYAARGAASARAGDRDAAAADFGTALSAAASTLHDDLATREVTQRMLDELGLDATLAAIERLAAGGAAQVRPLEVLACTTKGDHGQAQAKAEALLKDVDSAPETERAAIYDAAASAYLYDGKADRARELYEKLLAIQPRHTEALMQLALFAAEHRSPPDAAAAGKYLDQATEAAQGNDVLLARLMETRGWVLVLAGRPDEGLPLIEAAADQLKGPLVHYHLGRAALLQGRREEARAELTTAQRLIEQTKAERKFVDPRLDSDVAKAIRELSGAERP